MSMSKEAGQAVNMLIDQGVDFDTAVNLVMEKTAGDKMRGYISPAWMESSIAKKHGKKSPDGVVKNTATHVKGTLRSVGNGLVGGAAGTVVGHHVGKLLGGAKGAVIGSAIAGNVGAIAGVRKSLKNQEAEMHSKYQEKKASFDSLIEQGYDFDTAADMVSAQ